MNRKDFLDIMDSSGTLDSRMTGDLNELVTVFPYFQSAHLLLLKGLKDNSDVRFGIQLRNSSIHIADREVLYRFLQEPPESIEEHLVVESLADQPVEIPADQPVEIPADQPVATPAEQPVEIIAEQPVEIIAEQPVEAPAEPPQSIIEEKVEAPVTEPDIQPEPEAEPVSESVPEAPEIAAPEPDSELLYTETEQSVIETAMNSEEIINQMESENQPAPEEEEDYRERIMMTPAEELPDSRKLQSELIDRFIIANPRIEASREKKEAPSEDKSVPIYNESVFVTETLAKIYINQGYYSKAIDIFEKLSLKYPEKSSYFATQIEKVKELLKK